LVWAWAWMSPVSTTSEVTGPSVAVTTRTRATDGSSASGITADQVLAVLEPLTQRANLDNARAALVSAEAQLTQAKVTFERQKQLINGG
jgi:multidrug resistance efflux pump